MWKTQFPKSVLYPIKRIFLCFSQARSLMPSRALRFASRHFQWWLCHPWPLSLSCSFSIHEENIHKRQTLFALSKFHFETVFLTSIRSVIVIWNITMRAYTLYKTTCASVHAPYPEILNWWLVFFDWIKKKSLRTQNLQSVLHAYPERILCILVLIYVWTPFFVSFINHEVLTTYALNHNERLMHQNV